VRSAARTAVGILVSAGLLLLLARQVEVGEIREALGDVRWSLIAAVVVLYFVGAWLRAVRWRLLFREPDRLALGHLFAATLVGYMGNNLRRPVSAKSPGPTSPGGGGISPWGMSSGPSSWIGSWTS